MWDFAAIFILGVVGLLVISIALRLLPVALIGTALFSWISIFGFGVETGTQVYFADPHAPWQRPTNENTNGFLRQYFPKGTDLSRWSAQELEAVAYTLNNRPRKVLGWRTPAEVFAGQLHSLDNTGVATTD